MTPDSEYAGETLYGPERQHFETSAIELWLSVDDSTNVARLEFVRTAIHRWKSGDWGSATDELSAHNENLVTTDTPGHVTGIYVVPEHLSPEAPVLAVTTRFRGHGTIRRLEACVVWGEPAALSGLGE